MACDEHYERVKSILYTWWVPSLCELAYGKHFGIEDKRENLGEKYRRVCEHFKDKEDYIFICDTDTYVHIPRLMWESHYHEHDFIGHVRNDWEPHYPYGGCGFWLSNKALRILSSTNWKDFTLPSYNYAADMTIGRILYGWVPLHHDSRYALYDSVKPDNDIISEHLSAGRHGPFNPQMMYEAHKDAH